MYLMYICKVLLAQCALFAEISLDSEERHVVLRYRFQPLSSRG